MVRSKMVGIGPLWMVLGRFVVTDPTVLGCDSPLFEGSRVEFSQRDREDAARLLAMIAGAERDPTSVARAIISDRHRRELIFNPGMFGEPGWDMLLTLFAMDQQGPRLTIGRLAQEARCALTTTLRWLEYLDNHGLVIREENPSDARTAFVRLSAKAREALREYLSQMLVCRL